MTSWAKGTMANIVKALTTTFCLRERNTQLIVFTDYNLLFEGGEQVNICFVAHYEWIAKQWIHWK